MAEITVTRSLNTQLFFVCHAKYKAFYKKKSHLLRLLHSIHAIFITISRQVKVIDLCWAFYWCIENHRHTVGQSIGIVFQCKHNLTHSYIQSLNPISKILNLNTFKYGTKLVSLFPGNQLATKAQPLPRKSSNTASAMIAHHVQWKAPRDFTWNRGYGSNSPPLLPGTTKVSNAWDMPGG